jgi:CheY-like chemotaxis protein
VTDSASLNVLLVEDDDVAAEAVVRGLRRHAPDCPVIVAEDGFVALQILRGQHDTHRLGKFHIVFLDLNMPRMNGFEFLKELRADRDLCGTVVFVLTTSDIQTDLLQAYQGCIAGYILKSGVGPQCSRLARFVTEYSAVIRFPG